MTDNPGFFFFDAAKAGETALEKAMQWKDHLISLYHGKAEAASLEIVAPYLLDLTGEDALRQFVEEEGWGKAWGYFIASEQSLQQLKDHFARFLFTRDEDGHEVFFRFYDPRVLKIVLPSWEKKQLVEFFRPLEYIIAEEEDGKGATKFWQQNGSLQHTNV